MAHGLRHLSELAAHAPQASKRRIVQSSTEEFHKGKVISWQHCTSPWHPRRGSGQAVLGLEHGALFRIAWGAVLSPTESLAEVIASSQRRHCRRGLGRESTFVGLVVLSQQHSRKSKEPWERLIYFPCLHVDALANRTFAEEDQTMVVWSFFGITKGGRMTSRCTILECLLQSQVS